MEELYEMLKENPDVVYIGPGFLAVYVPSYGKLLVLQGDYQDWSEDDVKLLIEMKFIQINAKLN